MKIHYHYRVVGFEKMANDVNGNPSTMIGATQIEVFADRASKALEKAKKMIIKPDYKIASVWECKEDHNINSKIAEELTNEMKGIMAGLYGKSNHRSN